MAITRTSQVDDDGSGTTGTIWNNAWKTELYDQIDANPAILSYTPVWGATGTPPALGPSTLTGRYVKQGSAVTVWIYFVIQSGATFGTGAWTFSLPGGIPPTHPFALSAYLVTGGAQIVAVSSVYANVHVVVAAPGAPNGIGGTLPGVWGIGDIVSISGTYAI